jgi:putative transposase
VELPLRMLDKNGQLRGGFREGAGRKPNAGPARAPHGPRPVIDRRHPQHVTLRVSDAIGWMRRLDMYTAIRRALRVVAAKHAARFRIVHVSVQNTHIHLICEAEDRRALSTGLRSFQVSAAKWLNAAVSKRRRLPQRRRGVVFVDRYHVENLGSVGQVRNALAYVLNNWRRHGVDRDALFTLAGGRLDPYASGRAFVGWSEANVGTMEDDEPAEGYGPPEVSEPTTWLARQGWTKARPISVFEVPAARARAASNRQAASSSASR